MDGILLELDPVLDAFAPYTEIDFTPYFVPTYSMTEFGSIIYGERKCYRLSKGYTHMVDPWLCVFESEDYSF
jgi:hypothetical protein